MLKDLQSNTMRKENQLAPSLSDSHQSLLLSLQASGGAFNLGGLMRVLLVTLFVAVVSVCYADTASYYTYKSCVREGTSGVWTASGERFNENDLTCAMRRRDWGTKFKVTNLANGKSVIVRLNDFGPNKKLHDKGRVIDLSKGAFMKISSLKQGVIRVKVEEI